MKTLSDHGLSGDEVRDLVLIVIALIAWAIRKTKSLGKPPPSKPNARQPVPPQLVKPPAAAKPMTVAKTPMAALPRATSASSRPARVPPRSAATRAQLPLPPLPSPAGKPAVPIAVLQTAPTPPTAPAAPPPAPPVVAQKTIAQWITPTTLRSQFILAEAFRPPVSLRPPGDTQ